jgi:hypothetical protein
MKFGDLFELFGQGFDSITKAQNTTDSKSAVKGNTEEYIKNEEKLRAAKLRTGEIAEKIANLDLGIRIAREKGAQDDLQAIEQLQKEKETLTERGRANIIIEEELAKTREEHYSNVTKSAKNLSKIWDKVDWGGKIEKDFEKNMEEMRASQESAFSLSDSAANQWAEDMEKLQEDASLSKTISQFQGGSENIKKSISNMGMDTMKNGIMSAGEAAGLAGPQMMLLSVAVDLLFEGLVKAWDKLLEMNDAMLNIQRSSGGMVDSLKFGADEFGSLSSGTENLSTKLALANVDTKRFSETLTGLFSGGFGQIAGMKDDLNDSADALLNFGTEAAKYKKLWGVDLVGAVRNLTMNYGEGIQESTDMATETAQAAKQMGLDMGDAVKNLEQAAQMAGKYYFKSAENMQNLALFATRLGADVNAMMSSISGLGHVTDLFQKQQSFVAMELGNTANNMAKVYALKQTGQADEASKLMVGSLAKDLLSKGMLGTEQGRMSLEQMGFDEETIKAVERLGRQAETTGASLEEVIDPTKANMLTQMQLKNQEIQNRSIGESIEMFTESVIGFFIDPIISALGPLVKSIINFGMAFWNLTKPVLKVISGMAFLTGIFQGFTSVWSTVIDAFSFVANWLDDKFGPVIKWVSDALSSLGEYLGIVIGIVSLALLPTLISYIASLAMGVITNIASFGLLAVSAFSAAIALISMAWPVILLVAAVVAVGVAVWYFWDTIVQIAKFMLNMYTFIPRKILEGLMWVGEAIWGFISGVFEPVAEFLFEIFKPVIDLLEWAFSPFIEIIDALIEGFKAVIDYFGWFSDDEKEETKSAIGASTWTDALGIEEDNIQPSTQADEASYKTTIRNVSELPELRDKRSRESGNTTGDVIKTSTGEKKNTSVVINSKVDGIFSNKQSMKKTI